jgi:F-type H+-transporting ATPase subunit epsilon
MPVTLKLVTPVCVLPPVTGGQVTFVASDGEIGIRQGHAPLVALVGQGVVEVVGADGGDRTFCVRGGVAQVLKDEVSVLVKDAVEVAKIDAARVQARLEAIAGGAKPDGDDEPAWLKAQLAVAGRHKPARAAH